MSDMPPDTFLVLQSPGQDQGRSFRIDPGIYTLGSDDDNMIVLKDPAIAWRHAVISYFEDGIWIEDLNTDSGTFIDGTRVASRDRISPGHRVTLGPYALEVQQAGQTPPAPAEPAPPPQEKAAAPKIKTPPPPPRTTQPPPPGAPDPRRDLKAQVQEALQDRLDIRRLTASHISEDDLHARVRDSLVEIINEVRDRLPPGVDPEMLLKEVYDEAVGLGPLEDLLEDPTITEIMVNGPRQVYIEREGKLELTSKSFINENSVLAIIERIVAPIGRRIDESQPYVDARLQDGSRVNAIIHPLSLIGPCLTIRKFSRDPLEMSDLIRFGSITPGVATFLDAAVKLRKNIVVSGGTGSGKTTLLNVISHYLPPTERIVTIEDAAELRLRQQHVIRLEARPPNIEGKGAITIRDLVRNALRMRPDRIVVGECRGGEALDMLQAMNTGHEGSLTTVHANAPRDAISRLETMVLMSGMDLPIRPIREQIGSAIHLIVQIARFPDGTRKVSRITEVVGLEGDQITMQDIFTFKQTGLGEDGQVHGQLLPTGSVPTFLEDLQTRGLSLDQNLFDPSHAASSL